MDPADNPEIIDLVGGLAPLFRLTGDESMSWTRYMVAEIIVVYNCFINAVDRVDQKHALPHDAKGKKSSYVYFPLDFRQHMSQRKNN